MEYSNTQTTLLPGNGVPLAAADPDQFSRALLSAMLSFRDGEFDVRMQRGMLPISVLVNWTVP